MKKYQYVSAKLDPDESPDMMLETMGKFSWELVAVTPFTEQVSLDVCGLTTVSVPRLRYIFKREMPEVKQ